MQTEKQKEGTGFNKWRGGLKLFLGGGVWLVTFVMTAVLQNNGDMKVPRFFNAYHVHDELHLKNISHLFEKEMTSMKFCPVSGDMTNCLNLADTKYKIDEIMDCDVAVNEAARMSTACSCLYTQMNKNAELSRKHNRKLTAAEAKVQLMNAKSCVFNGQRVTEIVSRGKTNLWVNVLWWFAVAFFFDLLIYSNEFDIFPSFLNEFKISPQRKLADVIKPNYAIFTMLILLVAVVPNCVILGTHKERISKTVIETVKDLQYDWSNIVINVILFGISFILFRHYYWFRSPIFPSNAKQELIIISTWANVHIIPTIIYCTYTINNLLDTEIIVNAWTVGLGVAGLIFVMNVVGDLWSQSNKQSHDYPKDVTPTQEYYADLDEADLLAKMKTFIMLFGLYFVLAYALTSYPSAPVIDSLEGNAMYVLLVILLLSMLVLPDIMHEVYACREHKSVFSTTDLVQVSRNVEFIYRIGFWSLMMIQYSKFHKS